MKAADAERWAMRLEPEGMAERMDRMEIWVAEADDRIVGWVGIQPGWLENLYRDPDPPWRGTGGALLAHAERLMRERGFHAVGLKSAASAVGFYRRHGYEPSAPPEPDGSWRHEKPLSSTTSS
jgi:GNAT superfamily N-acetyltransferase